MSPAKTLAAAALMAAAPLLAQAATILDTRDPGTGSFFNLVVVTSANQDPLAQSFALAADGLNLSVTSTFTSLSSGAVALTGSLVLGAGTGGAVVASVMRSATAAQVAGRMPVDLTFDFSAAGTLGAGTYSFVVTGDGALGGGVVGVDTPGTESFNSDGIFDFRSNRAREFGVTVTADPVAPVPLPAAGFLLVGAMGGLAALRRRR